MRTRDHRIALVLAVAVAAAAAPACGQRKAKEACEDFFEQLSSCAAFGMGESDCGDVTRKERDKYECLASLEDVCDIESHKDCG